MQKDTAQWQAVKVLTPKGMEPRLVHHARIQRVMEQKLKDQILTRKVEQPQPAVVRLMLRVS